MNFIKCLVTNASNSVMTSNVMKLDMKDYKY